MNNLTFLHCGGARINIPKSQQIKHTKKCVPKFPILSAIKAINYYLHVYLWVLEIWTVIYLHKEWISKHSGKKIMQLVWIFVACLLKTVEHRIEHDIDSAYGVCIHKTFLNFTTGLMNTWQFKQLMNLTVCWFVIL